MRLLFFLIMYFLCTIVPSEKMFFYAQCLAWGRIRTRVAATAARCATYQWSFHIPRKKMCLNSVLSCFDTTFSLSTANTEKRRSLSVKRDPIEIIVYIIIRFFLLIASRTGFLKFKLQHFVAFWLSQMETRACFISRIETVKYLETLICNI